MRRKSKIFMHEMYQIWADMYNKAKERQDKLTFEAHNLDNNSI